MGTDYVTNTGNILSDLARATGIDKRNTIASKIHDNELHLVCRTLDGQHIAIVVFVDRDMGDNTIGFKVVDESMGPYNHHRFDPAMMALLSEPSSFAKGSSRDNAIVWRRRQAMPTGTPDYHPVVSA